MAKGCWKCCATLLLLVATAACAPGDAIDEYVRAEIEHRRIPGMAVAVVKDKKIVKQQVYGLASVELDVAVRPETVFVLASITKTFVSAGILLLMEEGKVSLDDSVTKLLPELPTTWAPVTIRHCLSHTSGLPDILSGDGFMAGTRSEVLRTLAGMPVNKPGDRAVYNQTGYMLLSMIIESVTGQAWLKFLTERLLQPLELTSTSYGDLREVVPGGSSMYTMLKPSLDRTSALRSEQGLEGYAWSQDGIYRAIAYLYPLFNAGAGLNSSIADMAKWELALATGRVLRPSTVDEAVTAVRLNSGETSEYGLGWVVGNRKGHRTAEIGGGWATWHLRLPDDDLSVIVLTNLQGSQRDGSLAMGIAGFYVAGLKSDGG